jgi:hypothetical protein
MCSHRPYRAAMGLSETLKELTENIGILYDAVVVETSLNLFGRNLTATSAVTAGLTLTAVSHPDYLASFSDVAPAQPESLSGEGQPWDGNLGPQHF